MRFTGFPDGVKNLVDGRSGGVCEIQIQGCSQVASQYHHRLARGMGGTRQPFVNEASNCLHVCVDCHSTVEVHRENAYANGWLVSKLSISKPCEVAVFRWGQWVLLDDEGGFEVIE